MTLASLEREFRYHFGSDAEAAGRVFDAFQNRSLDVFVRPEVFAGTFEQEVAATGVPPERLPPDEPMFSNGRRLTTPEYRSRFVDQLVGAIPVPGPGVTFRRMLVDRDQFATWAGRIASPEIREPPAARRGRLKRTFAERWDRGEFESKGAAKRALAAAAEIDESTARRWLDEVGIKVGGDRWPNPGGRKGGRKGGEDSRGSP